MGFADRGPGCLVIVQVAEVRGVVERAVGKVAAVERWCRPATAMSRQARPPGGGHRYWPQSRWSAPTDAPHCRHRFHNTHHRKTQDRP